MRTLLLFASLSLVFSCAKEDSQNPNTPPSDITKQYALTVSAGEGGSVSTTGGTFSQGTQVSITATPSEGYSFSGWSNGSSDNPLSVTLNSNTSVTANFQVIVNSYTLTVTAGEGGNVSSEGGEYEEGTEVTITATPDEGYEFVGWQGFEGNNSEITINLNSNLSLVALFELTPYGYVEDGIFLDAELYDYDPIFQKNGNGSVKVVLADLFESSEGQSSHGNRMIDTFNYYADNENVTLYSFNGDSSSAISSINTTETTIISASAHGGSPFEIVESSYDDAEKLKLTNALYLSSLENGGVDGSIEDGAYPFPHANNCYVIQNDSEALGKTIFVAWYSRYSWGGLDVGVDMHGGFVEDNIQNVIFVEMTTFPEETGNGNSTSHATPKLAAFSAKILHNNPTLSAEELKNEVLSLTTIEERTIRDLASEVINPNVDYEFTQNGYGYYYEYFDLMINLLSDETMSNYPN